ncbi:hypothetical protein [Sphaerotilus mobilis]|uniref:PsiF repeat-containing protein n=1 Tax=Sphaerotilus mobilis TaxID=47994 RepID=A0A4Q7LKA2_9BURK|nr:hypothetical protein [Sphaerotilus mobilis]RZS54483.1 hypothetical protein EV685_1960 [Sphaerotilus mobilis]
MTTTFRHLVAIGLLAVASVSTGLAQAADAATAPAAAASGATKPHVTARAMQERSAKFSACRKTALDSGLQGEALKQALVTCMQ